MANQNDEVAYTRVLLERINEHKERYRLQDIVTTRTEEYRKALSDGAFFWIDHNDYVRSTLSGEIFATNREQLDALIEHLQEYRGKMVPPPDFLSEK
jgi:hypothetical protein